MFYHGEGIVRQAADPGDGLDSGDELIADDDRRWEPPLLQGDTVVHTARTTGASITYRYDSGIELLGYPIQEFGGRHIRNEGLSMVHYLSHLILLLEKVCYHEQ